MVKKRLAHRQALSPPGLRHLVEPACRDSSRQPLQAIIHSTQRGIKRFNTRDPVLLPTVLQSKDAVQRQTVSTGTAGDRASRQRLESAVTRHRFPRPRLVADGCATSRRSQKRRPVGALQGPGRVASEGRALPLECGSPSRRCPGPGLPFGTRCGCEVGARAEQRCLGAPQSKRFARSTRGVRSP